MSPRNKLFSPGKIGNHLGLLLRKKLLTEGIRRKTVEKGSRFSEMEAGPETVVAATGAGLGRVPARIGLVAAARLG